jgi:hypothetical protein
MWRGEALGIAMTGECDRRWSLLGDCCRKSGSWEQPLQAGGGESRSFGGSAEILSSLGLLGLRGSERRRGAMRQRNRWLWSLPEAFPTLLEFSFEI